MIRRILDHAAPWHYRIRIRWIGFVAPPPEGPPVFTVEEANRLFSRGLMLGFVLGWLGPLVGAVIVLVTT